MIAPISISKPSSNGVGAKVRLIALATGLAVLAGCATPAPPPPPPAPPPPPVVLIPAKPVPPLGASAIMAIPPIGADGQRMTVNSGISTAQTTWNVRSAFNVAALNCLDTRYAAILPNYRQFLATFERPLRTTNTTVGREFRDRFGRRTYRAEQDAYMTQVYNYFALPPALDNFCQVALDLTNESLQVAPSDLDSFSARALARMEAVFEDFFRAHEQYQRDIAAWNATYGPNAVPGTPVPDGVKTGSLAPTPAEQVLYRENPDGTQRNDGLSGQRDGASVTVLPSVDPGASETTPAPTLDSDSVLVTEPAAETTPAPESNDGVVFTSEPVVQDPGRQ